MGYTVSMDKAGRIIIPKPVRQQLGIGSCATFQLDLILDRVELTPSRPPQTSSSKLIEKDGFLLAKKTGKSFDAAQAIRQDREDRAEFLNRSDDH